MPDFLPDHVHAHACVRPAHRALVFLDEGESIGAQFTYGELDLEVRRVAALIRERAGRQSCVLLVHSPGYRFAIDFLACLYAGAIPVPVYPGRRRDRLSAGSREVQHADKVAAATAPRLLLSDLGDTLGNIAPGVHRLDSTAVPIGTAVSPLEGPVKTKGTDIALVQFTSGSTGDPRGAVVTHSNILDNQRRIHRAFRQDGEAVVVSWLPLYHDMGLIGSLLHSLYLGATCFLMSPVAFMQRPLRWLRAMSDFKGTITAAPNFAYELAAQRAVPADVETLDLSGWQVAVCGGEPVRVSTIDRFTEVFAPAGFDRSAFSPAYGLAEATLLVSAVEKGVVPSLVTCPQGDHGHGIREFVSNGQADEGVVIVSHQGERLAAGEVGEIWVRQGSVAQGYWGKPPGQNEVFGRHLADGEGAYLNTGDLGFTQAGDLYVTGRSKDLLIVRGRNLWPQDIEFTVEQASKDVRPGCVAAVQVDDDLVVIAEVRGSAHVEVAAAMTAAVSAEHGVHLTAVKLLGPGSIPKTSSGKIRRRACRELYLADIGGELLTTIPDLHKSRVDEVLGLAAGILGGVRGGSLSPDDSLVASGLDSLSCVALQYELETRFGVTVALEALMQGASARELADVLGHGVPEQRPPKTRRTGRLAELAGPELSVGQQSVWLASQLRPGAAPFTIARAAAIPEDLKVTAIEHALSTIVERHQALRTRIVADGAHPKAVVESS